MHIYDTLDELNTKLATLAKADILDVHMEMWFDAQPKFYVVVDE